MVGIYRISDIVLGVIANVFYQDLGFSKAEIAAIVKTFGLFMTIAGGFLGGVLAVRYGVIRTLMLGVVLSAATNLLFMLLAYLGHDTLLLYVVISADNLSAGLASTAFVAFLSSLTSVSFTAVQYAIFSSLMTLFPKLLKLRLPATPTPYPPPSCGACPAPATAVRHRALPGFEALRRAAAGEKGRRRRHTARGAERKRAFGFPIRTCYKLR